DPLDAEESAQLVGLLLEQGRGSREHAEIVGRAEGNPFFLEEIARTRTEAIGNANGLPDTVHAALAARIDLLPTDEKRALQTPAGVGRGLWPPGVAELAALAPG